MATIISVSDLPTALRSVDMIEDMIAGANAKASRVAPCLTATETTMPTVDQLAEARLVLLGAVKRWAEAGSGALQSQTAGPFSVGLDTRQRTGFNLWPSEITALQEICTGDSGGTVYSISLAGPDREDGYWSAPNVWTPL